MSSASPSASPALEVARRYAASQQAQQQQQADTGVSAAVSSLTSSTSSFSSEVLAGLASKTQSTEHAQGLEHEMPGTHFSHVAGSPSSLTDFSPFLLHANQLQPQSPSPSPVQVMGQQQQQLLQQQGGEVSARPAGSAPSSTSFSPFSQRDENDRARCVVLHAPQVANWMGGLHPNGSLYERPVRLEAAAREHREFRRKLEAEGVTVLTVREILLKDCESNVLARLSLEELAFEALRYKLCAEDLDDEMLLSEEIRYFLSEEYKRECIDKMDEEQLVDVILTRPTVHLRVSARDTALQATSYSFHPLVNLVFTRDQQVTTNRGLVIGALASKVRAPEISVMKYCWTKLGVPIVGEISGSGRLEGGDFLPAGEDLCFVGIGLRSNVAAVRQMLRQNLFGTRRVAVVKDFFDYDQQRMHLDTVCNIVSNKLIICLENTLGLRSRWRRLVDEYVMGADGDYRLARHDIEWEQYLTGEGYDIIRLTNKMQEDYGCNALNLGGGVNVFVDLAAAKAVARSPKFSGQIITIDFRHMADMYGSVHCCSQVIQRQRQENGVNGVALSPVVSADQISFAAALAPEISRPRSGPRFLMVAPNNCRFPPRAEFSESLPYFKKGVLDVRKQNEAIMDEFSGLHEMLTVDLGLEVFLRTHDLEEKIPNAIFVQDIVSLHRADESSAVQAVLYPLRDPKRRAERRLDILELLEPFVDEWIDLTPCERGVLQPSSSPRPFEEGDLDLHDAQGKFLSRNNLIFDDKNRVLYVRLDDDANAEVAELLASALGYHTVMWHAKSANSEFLFVGSDYAIFCPSEVVEADRDVVADALVEGGYDVVTISAAQAKLFCAAGVEVTGESSGSCLILSEKAFRAFDDQQAEKLFRHAKVCPVPLTHLEMASQRSMRGMIVSLP